MFREFQEYCFRVPAQENARYMERLFQIEDSRAVVTDDGEIRAVMELLRTRMYIDGKAVPMWGIGGVASVPENRRSGHVGAILLEAIREMKQHGVPLSTLYPFKQSFYRRYGWEVASAWLWHQIPVGLLAPYRRQEGHVRRYLPGKADWQELESIYRRWAEPRRGFLERGSEARWQHVLLTWQDRPLHVAVWRPSASAEPEGYMAYRFDKVDGRDALFIREMVALTPQAERGLLGYAANHDSQVKLVGLRTDREYPLWHLVENTDEVISRLESGWELRLIDVAAAFAARPWPEGVSGTLLIGVQDEHAPWNQGTWKVSFGEGRAEVEPAPGETPQLAASVQTWAQLYAGMVRPQRAAATRRLEASDLRALRLLTEALAGDPLFFFDFF